MAGVHSKETRSYNMSRIRGKDTKPELLVRKFLHKNGFRLTNPTVEGEKHMYNLYAVKQKEIEIENEQ